MGLTQLELFKATVLHRQHEKFLYYMGFTPDLHQRIHKHYGLAEGQSIGSYLGMYEPGYVGLQAPQEQSKPDFSPYFSDMEIPVNAFINGLGVLEIPGSMYHFTRYVSPLRNAKHISELEAFPYPNVTGFTDSHIQATVDRLHRDGLVASSWVGHMYEDSWQIRGYEEFLMDMIIQPEWCEYILDQLTKKNLRIAAAVAAAGVDVIRTGDDVANQNALMFSADTWRRFIKPRWAAVYAEARRIKPDIQIWYHSDGNIIDIIPDLIEIGVTILNPVQPECMDPFLIKKKYGDKLVLDGTIGTQTTMPFATPDQVRRLVRERIETLGQDGALIISPTHVLEPEVPIENIQALVDAVREFG